MDLGVLVEEALQTDFADGEKKEEKTSKRVANFKKQVEKGVRDMKVILYTVHCTLVHSVAVQVYPVLCRGCWHTRRTECTSPT